MLNTELLKLTIACEQESLLNRSAKVLNIPQSTAAKLDLQTYLDTIYLSSKYEVKYQGMYTVAEGADYYNGYGITPSNSRYCFLVTNESIRPLYIVFDYNGEFRYFYQRGEEDYSISEHAANNYLLWKDLEALILPVFK